MESGPWVTFVAFERAAEFQGRREVGALAQWEVVPRAEASRTTRGDRRFREQDRNRLGHNWLQLASP